MYICPSHISVLAVLAGPGETGVYRSKSESSTGQTILDGPYFKKRLARWERVILGKS